MAIVATRKNIAKDSANTFSIINACMQKGFCGLKVLVCSCKSNDIEK